MGSATCSPGSTTSATPFTTTTASGDWSASSPWSVRAWGGHRDADDAGGNTVTAVTESLIGALAGSSVGVPPARWLGVYPAVVDNIVDPDGQGRVRITLPWSPDASGAPYQAW